MEQGKERDEHKKDRYELINLNGLKVYFTYYFPPNKGKEKSVSQGLNFDEELWPAFLLEKKTEPNRWNLGSGLPLFRFFLKGDSMKILNLRSWNLCQFHGEIYINFNH